MGSRHPPGFVPSVRSGGAATLQGKAKSHDINVPSKPKKAQRRAAEPKAATGGKRSGIEPEALKAFIGKSQEGAASLQQIADNFSVREGVAERAVKAIPGVKSGTGTKSDGQRGKAPIVYWAE